MAVESPWATQDLSIGAEQTRRAVFFGFNAAGVKGSGCAASAPGGMSVQIATGEMLVAGSVTTTQGYYYVRVSSATTVTIAAASSSNPRIDVVCATVNDVAYAGSGSSSAVVQSITGTPAGSPVAPSLPANSLALVQVLVPQSASSITSGDLTDERLPATLAFTGTLQGKEPVDSAGTFGSTFTLPSPLTYIGTDGTFSANCTFTMPTAFTGAVCWVVTHQPSSGGTYNYTPTFTGVNWAGGSAPAASTGAGATDLWEFFSTAGVWRGTAILGFAA